MEKVALFGAGRYGRAVARKYNLEGKKYISYFIDNDEKKWGTFVDGIQVISLDEFVEKYHYCCELILSVGERNRRSIEKQLHGLSITEYKVFDVSTLWPGGRVVSYSLPINKEDLILYNVLKDESEIFYIDVGSNDPFLSSVTKLLYDVKHAHGINIEPQKWLVESTNKERVRDINLCVGVGNEPGEMTLYCQGGLSTVVEENKCFENPRTEVIQVMTLKQICEKYVQENQIISFLKVDVEGFEKQVLQGADFKKYRPEIVVMESTIPATEIPSYEEWESILLDNKYHFVFTYGVNRYYVADEKSEIDIKFCSMDELLVTYDVYYPKPIEE